MRISDWSSDVCSSDLIASGQERVLLAWHRLILPGGRSLRLDRQPGADARGMAGVADRTDHHCGSMLRAALISTLLGVGADLGSDGANAIVRALRGGSLHPVTQSDRNTHRSGKMVSVRVDLGGG